VLYEVKPGTRKTKNGREEKADVIARRVVNVEEMGEVSVLYSAEK